MFYKIAEIRALYQHHFDEALSLIHPVLESEPRAMAILSFLYYDGRGVDRSKEKSFLYSLRAAWKGDWLAQTVLAWHYGDGDIIFRGILLFCFTFFQM